MRVLLSTIGSRGEFEPTLALAVRLYALGHEVRLVAPPDFRGLMGTPGISFVPIGPDLGGKASAKLTPEQLRKAGEQSVIDQFETVSAQAEGFDAVVGTGMLQPATHSAAERLGIPYAFGTFCPQSLPSAAHPPLQFGGWTHEPGVGNTTLWAREADRFNAGFLAVLNSCRTSAGMPEIADVREHMLGERPMLAADPVLAPWPDPGGVLQTGAWIRADERPLDVDLVKFLDDGEPPVYFGFGSMRVGPEYSAAAIGAARELGRRAIVLRGWADLSVVDSSPDCVAIGEVNHQELVKRLAAVVHHGGAGTTTTVARAGTPQVVVPQMFDQFYFADRVRALGIGHAHLSKAPTAESLAAALDHALRSEVVARAGEVSAEIAVDGVEIAARHVLSGIPAN
ncbi:hypothetical protein ALI144C_15070 [Actinosynnema sp. ALI-1.44]|uniref:glycosyltransferase n=1 Tax=Actinosynnema sp. ALI-1.44 TaxID=1933779 RepID=UPI00097C4EB2|nr:glycosyltransferase [Actinosynnema sp. ALI-1.44]ONI84469.1 hypothetical protein ALI144C_15070 [Actinosynnema sp. ALI-1.44]